MERIHFLCRLILISLVCITGSSVNASAGDCPSTYPVLADPDFKAGVLNPANLRKFVTELPNPLAPSFIFSSSDTIGGENHYAVSMKQITQSLGLIDDSTGCALPVARVWTYGDARGQNAPAAFHSFPGPTFDVSTDVPVRVSWTNELPADHILPVDPTLDCGPNAPNCFPHNRVTPHVHGSHVAWESDGHPDTWFTPNFSLTGHAWQPNTQFGPTGTFRYPNDQEAATLWYHDHAMGTTHLNVAAGLAGFFILRDDNERALMDPVNGPVLPSYPYEVPIVIQDRMFDARGQIALPDQPVRNLLDQTCQFDVNGEVIADTCPVVKFSLDGRGALVPDPAGTLTAPSITPEFFGNVALVNGQAWPRLTTQKTIYRFRILNGSDSRTYFLKFSDPAVKVWQIGTDQGFLNNPVDRSTDFIILMPGERIDTLIDFRAAAGDSRIYLRNHGPDGPFMGEAVIPDQPLSTSLPVLMAFDMIESLNQQEANPPSAATSLRGTVANTAPPFAAFPSLSSALPVRKWTLQERSEEFGRLTLTLDGKPFMDVIDNIIPLNSTEIWEIANMTPDAHPMHPHLVQFQLIERELISYTDIGAVPLVPHTAPPDYVLTGFKKLPEPYEQGWKDTLQMLPGTVTRIIAKFDISGLYVFHCHILSHEENEMMRPYFVEDPAIKAGASPAAIDFGFAASGTTAPSQTVTISNTGTQPVNIVSVVISGDMDDGAMNWFMVDPGDGTAGSCGLGKSLAAAESCTVSVIFSPAGTGMREGSVIITSNAVQIMIPVTGTGAIPVDLTIAGNGSGTVDFSPAPLNGPSACSSSCTKFYPAGTPVSLTAAASATAISILGGSCGSINGNGTASAACSTVMTAGRVISADFSLPALSLTFAGNTGGTVSLSPAASDLSLSCTGSCTKYYNRDTLVMLTAAAPAGAVATFSGACASTNGNGSAVATCSVSMYTNRSITAAFTTVASIAVITPLRESLVIQGRSVAIGWKAPDTMGKFNVWYSLNNGATWRLITSNLSGYSYSWRVPLFPTQNTTARIMVAGYTSTGRMLGKAVSDTFTLVMPKPAAPAAFTASKNGSQVTLTWRDIAVNETSYIVQRKTGGGNYITVRTLPANSRTYSETVLNGTYTYSIYAVNYNGRSPAVTSNTVTVP